MTLEEIVYDLCNLVYNDSNPSYVYSDVATLYTSVSFDILGYVLSQNF